MDPRHVRVLGSFLVLFVVYGIWQSGSVLLPAIVAQEGWGIARTSSVFSVAFLVYGLVSPVVGWGVDRTRPMAVFRVGAVLLVVGLLVSSLALGPVTLALAYGVVSASGIAAIGVIPQAVYIRTAEHAAPGRALGIAQIGLGLGPMVIIPLAGRVASEGWRMAFLALSALAVVVVAAGLRLIAVADRDTPATPVRRPPDLRLEYRGLVRSSQTWWLVLGVTLLTSAMMGVIVHQVVYLTDGGVSLGVGSIVAGGVALVSALARPVWGWVSDHRSRRFSFVWLGVLVSTGMWLLRIASNNPSPLLLAAYVVVFGTGYGAVSPLFPVIAEDVHGKSALGRTFGIMGVGIGLGSATGASLMGALRERWGTYDVAIFVPMVALFAAVLLLGSTVRRAAASGGQPAVVRRPVHVVTAGGAAREQEGDS